MEDVIQAIMGIDTDLKKLEFPISVFYDFIVLESEHNMLTFDSYENKKKVQICYYFHNYEQSKPIFDAIQSFQDKDDELFVSISSFFYDGQKQLKATENIKVKDDFSYNSLDYYPFLNTQEMFKQYMLSDSNILLLCGTPGTGKTKLGDAFMQHLLEVTDIEIGNKKQTVDTYENDGVEYSMDIITQESEGVKVAYVKNEEILADDIFWNMLREEEYHLVFLDDLDYSLLPRTQNISTSEDIQKNKFISNLLSFTDGIFESGNKTKFIVTTNKEVKDIDTAVLRKGRTFDILELRELKHEEAAEIWIGKGLDLDNFNEEFKEQKVLQADLGSAISMALKAKATNIDLKPYILEEGISLYSRVKNPKKIGI
jgi:DNA replication protein DnaC